VSQDTIARARAIRRRRVRERQAVVFGLLAALLGVIGLWAVGVYNGAVALPFDQGFSAAEKIVDPVKPTACLPANTLPVGAKKITVNVMNASDQAGRAASVAKELGNRGMKIGETGNATTPRTVTSIVYGPKGLAAAYTLSAHFTESALILDDTVEDASLTVNIGSSFKSLVSVDDVALEAQTPMVTREGCTDLWDLTDKAEPPAADDAADATDESDTTGDPNTSDGTDTTNESTDSAGA